MCSKHYKEKGILASHQHHYFVKDLENPQFPNSGAKMAIMWGYTCGAKIYGAKVVFVKKVDFGVR